MRKITFTLLLAVSLIACSKNDDEENCDCEGEFQNIETGASIHQPTDCDRTPPEGYFFVKCLTPSY